MARKNIAYMLYHPGRHGVDHRQLHQLQNRSIPGAIIGTQGRHRQLMAHLAHIGHHERGSQKMAATGTVKPNKELRALFARYPEHTKEIKASDNAAVIGFMNAWAKIYAANPDDAKSITTMVESILPMQPTA